MVIGSLAAVHGETRAGNQQTIDLLKQFPDHLHGYASANPHYAEEAAAELDRCFRESENFAGIELDCRVHGLPLDAPGYESTLEFAQARALPVLVHETGEEDWDDLAVRFPDIAFIVEGAIDPFDPSDADHLATVRQHANLYLALTGLVRWRGALAKLLELVGAHKVLFGSGFPARDLAHALGLVQLGELNSVARVDLCGGNALRIFKTIKPGKLDMS
jgi:predicted TIM-barrel fold metal-dependent hydrolase